MIYLWLVSLCGCTCSPFVNDAAWDARWDIDQDGIARPADCDDRNPNVGVLNWYFDSDTDGFGAGGGIEQCSPIDGYVTRNGDCDDADPALRPDAIEICDEIDNDCDTLLDELDDELEDGLVRYEDIDSDGWGSTVQRTLCEEEIGWISTSGDCDDADPALRPDAIEICKDGIDNNCNGVVDSDSVDVPWYRDADQDGYGDTNDSQPACVPPEGYVEDATDCNDGASTVNPGVEETCNNQIDDNCDGGVNQCQLAGTVSLSEADAKYNGETTGDLAGWATVYGDLNGDDIKDLVVGANSEDTGGSEAGAVYVFFGPLVSGQYSLAVADVKLTGEGAGDYAGHSLSANGDLNGDGVNDLAIGAINVLISGSTNGEIYVFFGPLVSGQYSLADADVKLAGENAGDHAGWSVTSDGDLNGDGSDDIAVGAESEDTGGSAAGAVYVFFGPLVSGQYSLADADVKLIGATGDDLSGYSLAANGDLNGDDVDDLAVGAVNADMEGTAAGVVYVFFGPLVSGQYSLADGDVKLIGESVGDYAGYSLVANGDLNGDGVNDLAVGAVNEDSEESTAGAVYVFFGPFVSGQYSLAVADVKLTGENAGDHAGWSVTSDGDLNGDGTTEILVGAPTAESGAIYLILGSSDMMSGNLGTIAYAKWTGESAIDFAGTSVSGGEDINNDGYKDILVSAPYHDSNGSNAGVVYLLFGLGL